MKRYLLSLVVLFAVLNSTSSFASGKLSLEPIYTRTARNVGEENPIGETKYLVDDGKPIFHSRENGAIDLAKRMLDKHITSASRKMPNA